MKNAEPNPLADLPPETLSAPAIAQLLHDCRNQLGGLKLYAAFLKKNLLNNTLDQHEGVEVCDKMLQQIDALTARTKEAARVVLVSNPSS